MKETCAHYIDDKAPVLVDIAKEISGNFFDKYGDGFEKDFWDIEKLGLFIEKIMLVYLTDGKVELADLYDYVMSI